MESILCSYEITEVDDKNKDIFTKVYECNICSKEFHTLNRLSAHKKSVHKFHKNNKCENCGKEFGKLSHLQDHISAVHEGLKKYECYFNNCDEAFSYPDDLTKHIRYSHARYKDHKCDTCLQEFVRLQARPYSLIFLRRYLLKVPFGGQHRKFENIYRYVQWV